MRSNPGYPKRRRIALPGHDYLGTNSYFVTIRVLHGRHIFGEVVEGEMRLNLLGQAVEEEWLRTPLVRPHVTLDAFIVMPNHFHAIIDLNRDQQSSGFGPEKRLQAPRAMSSGAAKGSLGAVLGQFKSLSSKRCRALGLVQASPLWLRRCYDRVIRSDSEKSDIRRYIWDNPRRWEQKQAMKREAKKEV